MQQFFFDTYLPDDAIVDREGVWLKDNASARNEALRGLGDAALQLTQEGNQGPILIVVRDQHGNRLYFLNCTISILAEPESVSL